MVSRYSHWSQAARVTVLSLCVFLYASLRGEARNEKIYRPFRDAQPVTVGIDKNDEVMAECSPNGRWLAFEYHEISNPLSPRIGIVRCTHGIASWHPLLKLKDREIGYLGDFSWSPDSHWLSAVEDDRSDFEDTNDLKSDLQVVKVNLETRRMFKLTHVPPYSNFGSGTAWLRSGLIIFSGLRDGSFYGVPANGGKVRKLVSLPRQQCGGNVSTFAVSQDEQRIAFAIEPVSENESDGCTALWVANLATGAVHAVRTPGLYPFTPFWLNANTILFSGMDKEENPLGIYRISLPSGTVTPILRGLYLSPFVCDSDRTLYFAWAPKLAGKDFVWHYLHLGNPFYGYHIWRVPLRDVLPQRSGQAPPTDKGQTTELPRPRR